MRSAGAINADLTTWYAARTAVSKGQSYNVAGRGLTRANLAEINRTISGLESELTTAQAEPGTAAKSGFGAVQLLRGP